MLSPFPAPPGHPGCKNPVILLTTQGEPEGHAAERFLKRAVAAEDGVKSRGNCHSNKRAAQFGRRSMVSSGIQEDGSTNCSFSELRSTAILRAIVELTQATPATLPVVQPVHYSRLFGAGGGPREYHAVSR